MAVLTFLGNYIIISCANFGEWNLRLLNLFIFSLFSTHDRRFQRISVSFFILCFAVEHVKHWALTYGNPTDVNVILLTLIIVLVIYHYKSKLVHGQHGTLAIDICQPS